MERNDGRNIERISEGGGGGVKNKIYPITGHEHPDGV
jgi:hypothetical protein